MTAKGIITSNAKSLYALLGMACADSYCTYYMYPKSHESLKSSFLLIHFPFYFVSYFRNDVTQVLRHEQT